MKNKIDIKQIAEKGIPGALIIFLIACACVLTSCKKEGAVASAETENLAASDGSPLRINGSGSFGQVGTSPFFFSFFYVPGTSGTCYIIPTGTGKFTFQYSNCIDAVGGEGWKPGLETRKIGYNIESLTGAYSFVGVYGWNYTGNRDNPTKLVEYYIVEKGTLTGGGTKYSGTGLMVDGHNYNCYKAAKNGPTVIGKDAPFEQYVDNWGGQTGTTGKISFQGHVTNWKKQAEGWGTTQDYQLFAMESIVPASGKIVATVSEVP